MFARIKTALCAIRHRNVPLGLVLVWIFFGGGALAVLACFVSQLLVRDDSNQPLVYVTLLAFLFCVNVIRLLSQKWLVSISRQEDESYVNHLLVTARTVQPTVGTIDNPLRPVNYGQKETVLRTEADRVEGLPKNQKVEWELLPLQNLLLDFMNVHVLISQARLKLDDLEEYAADTAYSIDREKFENLRHSVLNAIDHATKAITKSHSLEIDGDQHRAAFVDDASAELRASIQAIQEYLIDYRWNWSNGNVTLAGLKLSCVVSIPVLLLAGLLPVGIFSVQPLMAWFNWAFVGASGAITSVLLAFRHSDETEVGHATSRREVSRALIAAVLGFVSGTIFYAVVGSGLAAEFLSVDFLPDVASTSSDQKLLGVVWAFVAGFVFEKAIDTVRNTLQG